jgi:hypothetical protein
LVDAADDFVDPGGLVPQHDLLGEARWFCWRYGLRDPSTCRSVASVAHFAAFPTVVPDQLAWRCGSLRTRLVYSASTKSVRAARSVTMFVAAFVAFFPSEANTPFSGSRCRLHPLSFSSILPPFFSYPLSFDGSKLSRREEVAPPRFA